MRMIVVRENWQDHANTHQLVCSDRKRDMLQLKENERSPAQMDSLDAAERISE
jgi:hypothetical protein